MSSHPALTTTPSTPRTCARARARRRTLRLRGLRTARGPARRSRGHPVPAELDSGREPPKLLWNAAGACFWANV